MAKIIKIGNDKDATIKFLKENNISYPLTFIPNVNNCNSRASNSFNS